MPIYKSDLDFFIAESDRLGGPNAKACQEYWSECEYRPEFVVNQLLDPFSDEYVAGQLSLYTEISGRTFDQSVNEHTDFDLERHVEAINPYDHGAPSGLAIHIERLSRAIRFAGPPRGGRLLDLGCGWGLSSELAAYCGLNVLSVDVNKSFVELVNRRAALRGLPITAVHGTFENFSCSGKFDMILFYECFHHSLKPWIVLDHILKLLAPGGKIAFAGEPVNDYWWESWGLRLDPLSVYCIRKFGWFESGWSLNFLRRMFTRAGLTTQLDETGGTEIGPVLVCSRNVLGRRTALDLWHQQEHVGWLEDFPYITSCGNSSLVLDFPWEASEAILRIFNFRGRGLMLKVNCSEKLLFSSFLTPGENIIQLEKKDILGPLWFSGETWSPRLELGSSDNRVLSFSLASVDYV